MSENLQFVTPKMPHIHILSHGAQLNNINHPSRVSLGKGEQLGETWRLKKAVSFHEARAGFMLMITFAENHPTMNPELPLCLRKLLLSIDDYYNEMCRVDTADNSQNINHQDNHAICRSVVSEVDQGVCRSDPTRHILPDNNFEQLKSDTFSISLKTLPTLPSKTIDKHNNTTLQTLPSQTSDTLNVNKSALFLVIAEQPGPWTNLRPSDSGICATSVLKQLEKPSQARRTCDRENTMCQINKNAQLNVTKRHHSPIPVNLESENIMDDPVDCSLRMECESYEDTHLVDEKPNNWHLVDHIGYVKEFTNDTYQMETSASVNTKTLLHQCDKCKQIFSDAPGLDKHADCQNVDLPHTCQTCGLLFLDPYSLQKHSKEHGYDNTPTVKPEVCEQIVDDDIDKHNVDKHKDCNNTDLVTHQCDTCGLFFVGYYSLAKHFEDHYAAREMECEVCGAMCLGKFGLQFHMKIHRTKRKMPPKISNKPDIDVHDEGISQNMAKAPNESESDAQERTKESNLLVEDTSEPRSECSVCHRKFDDGEDFVECLSCADIDETLQCDICELYCSTEHDLQIHYLKHDKDRTWTCCVCEHPCLGEMGIQLHMRVHLNKPQRRSARR